MIWKCAFLLKIDLRQEMFFFQRIFLHNLRFKLHSKLSVDCSMIWNNLCIFHKDLLYRFPHISKLIIPKLLANEQWVTYFNSPKVHSFGRIEKNVILCIPNRQEPCRKNMSIDDKKPIWTGKKFKSSLHNDKWMKTFFLLLLHNRY